MAEATHASEEVPVVRALLSQVHPVFMLPPLSASLFGGVFAGSVDPVAAGAHVAALFFAVYTAHVKDGYVDFHVRGEDDSHPLSAPACRRALAGSTVGFLGALAAVWALAGPGAAALTAPTWALGYFHAPQLDTDTVGATMGYPTGIALGLLGGFYVQAGRLTPAVVGLAGVFLLFLSGIKVIDDAQDFEYDRSIDKRTVAVVLGERGAYRAAYALMATGMVAVVALALGLRAIPPTAGLAAVVFGAVALLARRADPELATMLLIRGSYLFLAVLVAAVWFRPLS
ncbi:UbiA family prenyltransferase [Halosimplex litoreum]|uniref:UbiA family prenyltransferase n=1 Tax=Halosimplex litoreum TaxID=1198301 RepID=A0A7T3KUL6_9EURY|nr:UbiA family prenyltransferase [Halosimplex litoreum]QPV62382.1 UbiA family prenyltransferase [Halosimplex litoreum]